VPTPHPFRPYPRARRSFSSPSTEMRRRTQKMQIVLGERGLLGAWLASAGRRHSLCGDLVEADGGFSISSTSNPCLRISCTTPAICSLSTTTHESPRPVAESVRAYGMSRITSGSGGHASGWRGLQRRIPLPYFRRRPGATQKAATGVEKPAGNGAATIITGMKPHSIGRTWALACA